MIPELKGRFQTRIFLNLFIGLPIIIVVGAIDANSGLGILFLSMLLIFGFLWDILFDYLQHKRWDADWPPIFTLISGFLEGVLVISIITYLTVFNQNLIFIYAFVWTIMFLFSLGPINILFPKRRFNGGKIWG